VFATIESQSASVIFHKPRLHAGRVFRGGRPAERRLAGQGRAGPGRGCGRAVADGTGDAPVRVVTQPIGLNLINQTTTSSATDAGRWDIVYRSTTCAQVSAEKDLTATTTKSVPTRFACLDAAVSTASKRRCSITQIAYNVQPC